MQCMRDCGCVPTEVVPLLQSLPELIPMSFSAAGKDAPFENPHFHLGCQRARESFVWGVFGEVVECGEGFVGYVPLAQNFADDAGGEACSDQAAHHAGCLLFVFGLADALAFQMFAGQSFFVGLGVTGFERLGDQFGRDALLLQVLADAALAQLLVLLAQAGVGLGVGLIVQIPLFLEACDDGCDDGLAVFAGLDARCMRRRSSASVRMRAAQGLDGIVVEAGFVEEGLGFAGFALEGHGFTRS